MKRCNEMADLYSLYNGFRVCDEHVDTQSETHRWGYSKDAGPCDQVIESRETFWRRHPNSRMYRQLFGNAS